MVHAESVTDKLSVGIWAALPGSVAHRAAGHPLLAYSPCEGRPPLQPLHVAQARESDRRVQVSIETGHLGVVESWLLVLVVEGLSTVHLYIHHTQYGQKLALEHVIRDHRGPWLRLNCSVTHQLLLAEELHLAVLQEVVRLQGT